MIGPPFRSNRLLVLMYISQFINIKAAQYDSWEQTKQVGLKQKCYKDTKADKVCTNKCQIDSKIHKNTNGNDRSTVSDF